MCVGLPDVCGGRPRGAKGWWCRCVVPETEHQKRRYEDAGRRREMRAGETLRKKELRVALGDGWMSEDSQIDVF